MDYKQVGGGALAGGGTIAMLLALFQSQGVDLMAQKHQSEIKVVMERAIANTSRLDRFEARFDRSIDEVKAAINSVSDILRDGVKDRYTRADHESYAQRVETRLQRLESEINNVQRQLNEHDRRARK